MSDRKRIKYVELNDFRAYKGSMTFDFTNKTGEVADLIAIYAPNGVGKTSFFDAIEWGLTGKIDRMENDIGDNKYKGSILKNRDSIAKAADVKIALENGNHITRKTRKLTVNQIQDYTPGYRKPIDHEVFSFNNWDTLILPHNRIESFVKDNTGAKKYDYWGSYWDPTGEERKKFEFLYKMKKQALIKSENLSSDIEANKLKLAEFQKTIEIIVNINKAINKFNKLVDGKNKIKQLNLNFSGKDYSVLINEIESKKNSLELASLKYENSVKNLGILDANFIKSFEKKIKQLKYNEYNYESWAQISLKANEKSNLIEQSLMLQERLILNNQLLETLKEIQCAGDIWFKKYENYKSTKLFVNSIIDKRKELENQLLFNDEQYKTLCEKQNVLTLKNDLDERKNKLNESSTNLYKIDRRLKRNEKWLIRFIELSNKVENLITLLENTKEDAKSSVIKDIDKLRLIQLTMKAPDMEEKNNIIMALENLINEKQIIENKISVEKGKYETAEKLSNELAEIIRIARNYISNQKSSVCPVCDMKYNSKEELLLRTNITKSAAVTMYLNNCRQYESNLNEVNNKIQECVKKWNDNLNLMLEENEKDITKYISIKKRIELLKKDIEKAKAINSNDYKSCINQISTLGYLNSEISIEQIEEWYSKELNKFNRELLNLTEMINGVKSEMGKNRASLGELLKEYESKKIESADFEKSPINLKFIDFLKKNNQKETILDINGRITSITSENFDLNQQLEKLKIKLEMLKWIDHNKINYYKNKASLYSSILKENTNDYEEICDKARNIFGKGIVSQNRVNYRVNKLRKSIERNNQKIDAISSIQFNGEIQEYLNSRARIENDLAMTLESFIKCKEIFDKLEKVYVDAKKVVEDKIKTVLNTPLMNDFYKKLEPHPVMRNMKYSLKFNDKDKPELEVLVTSEKEEYIPEWYFSSAQLNVVALTTFFGRANTINSSPIDTIFIDDPVGHFDELNILAFVDMLRAMIEKNKKQIIISTHDEVVYNLMKRKLSEEYYSTKFIELGYRK
ncbi:AAA family ATPase [Candidatus Clostridium radicumherbarum]|uniref:Nuclease SbcCD subunit C n=1 Tax=Candidatus Clostridium radicumherbarum TaxID=3381662 RepID=A0ABW8TRF7_9CLOT